MQPGNALEIKTIIYIVYYIYYIYIKATNEEDYIYLYIIYNIYKLLMKKILLQVSLLH